MSEQKTIKPPSVDPATQAPISTQPLISKKTRTTTIIVSVLVVLVVLAVLIGLGYLLFASYDWATDGTVPVTVRLRDIAFIVMALETLVLMVLVLIVIVLLVVLVVLIYDRVIPILEQLNKAINTVVETTHTVRGTTTFVSEKVVTPFIEVSSLAAGITRILKGIFDLVPRPHKSVQVKAVQADEGETTSKSS
ncbi:MAG: hypothetical protein JW934_09160 [Anaerolineae bacterium]|nr:hypothetical protein [Anaerolineae bacterium]